MRYANLVSMATLGRPSTGKARGKVLAVRLSDEEAALLAAAADLESAKKGKTVTVSEYLRVAGVDKAKRAK